jgi:hypothetical protein
LPLLRRIMFRRRRPVKNESIQFSFDSFLDLVTNVVGIIIRLILVTWVGARSYHASMEWLNVEAEKKTTPAPRIADDPLHAKLLQSKNDLDDAKTKLLARLKDLDDAKLRTQEAQTRIVLLSERRAKLEAQRQALTGQAAFKDGEVRQASLTLEQIRRRSKKLLEDVKAIEKEPPLKKELKYHAPVSRKVQSEELFFECQNGRICYIDMPAFQQEMKSSLDEIGQELRTTYSVERTTRPVGPFRLRYTVERERSGLDVGAAPASEGGFRYGLSGWVVEPITLRRGETLEQALAPKSEFRQLTDRLDARISTVTFWVYPDSFELFRHLRDRLYEKGLEIAGRPLPPGTPIAASRNGSASRGQ